MHEEQLRRIPKVTQHIPYIKLLISVFKAYTVNEVVSRTTQLIQRQVHICLRLCNEDGLLRCVNF